MQTETTKYVDRGKLLLPLLIFAFVWAYIFGSSGIIHAGFNYFVDDHAIVVSYQNYTSFDNIFIEPFTSLFSSQPKNRFRPLYDVFVRLFAQVYGLNSEIWYLSSLLVATLTTGIFYLIGVLQKFSNLEAIGFAGFIVFGQQAATYTRFGTPETTATLLVALAILFASVNVENWRVQFTFDFLFVIFALCSALNKEACILMLPALGFFKTWNLSNQRQITLKKGLAKNKFVTLSILSIFAILIFYIKANNISGPGYAGIDQNTLSIEHLISSLTGNGAIFAPAILVNLIYLIKYRDRQIRAFYIFMALAIVPQLIIYNKTSMFWHYVLPAAIGVSWLIFHPIREIGKKSSRDAKVLTVIVLVITILQIIFTKTYFQDVANRVGSVRSLLTDVSTCGDRQTLVAILGNPYIDSEMLDSFKIIADRVIKKDRIYLATYGSQKSQLNIPVMQQREQAAWDLLDPEVLATKYQHMTVDRLDEGGRSKIKAIVLANASQVEQPLAELNLDWFQLTQLTKKYYPQIDMSVYCQQ